MIQAEVHDLVWRMAERAGHRVASIRTERNCQSLMMLIRINTVNGSTIALHYVEPGDNYPLSDLQALLLRKYPDVFEAPPTPVADPLAESFKKCFQRIDNLREDLELIRQELAGLKALQERPR